MHPQRPVYTLNQRVRQTDSKQKTKAADVWNTFYTLPILECLHITLFSSSFKRPFHRGYFFSGLYLSPYPQFKAQLSLTLSVELNRDFNKTDHCDLRKPTQKQQQQQKLHKNFGESERRFIKNKQLLDCLPKCIVRSPAAQSHSIAGRQELLQKSHTRHLVQPGRQSLC